MFSTSKFLRENQSELKIDSTPPAAGRPEALTVTLTLTRTQARHLAASLDELNQALRELVQAVPPGQREARRDEIARDTSAIAANLHILDLVEEALRLRPRNKTQR
jgi:hypothetical protein